jgi:hypothetical protein
MGAAYTSEQIKFVSNEEYKCTVVLSFKSCKKSKEQEIPFKLA